MLLRRLIEIFVCFNNNVLAEMQGHVIEGDDVDIEQYPHSVFMHVVEPAKGWKCCASIINQQFMLTAAHCLTDCTRSSHVSVTVGHADIRKGLKSSAFSIQYHKNFKRHTFLADIGLIKLKTPLKLGPNIQRVILMRNPPYEKVAYIAGWGLYTREKEKVSEVLKHAMQPLWSLRECRKIMGRILDDCICAGPKNGGPHASGGDSGSALVIQDHIQIGVFSFRRPVRNPSIGVYLNVSYYIDWIASNMASMACGK